MWNWLSTGFLTGQLSFLLGPALTASLYPWTFVVENTEWVNPASSVALHVPLSMLISWMDTPKHRIKAATHGDMNLYDIVLPLVFYTETRWLNYMYHLRWLYDETIKCCLPTIWYKPLLKDLIQCRAGSGVLLWSWADPHFSQMVTGRLQERVIHCE